MTAGSYELDPAMALAISVGVPNHEMRLLARITARLLLRPAPLTRPS